MTLADHRRDANAEGAFVPDEIYAPEGGTSGPLSGITFAAKDLLDVAGRRTGGGNPDWCAAQAPAERTATVIEALQRSGAALVGKTVTDELAFSLEGENTHYGTPTNPRNRDWLPGGSSSGSAVAVAAGRCVFALGTDTGGSVRVPAAFCGTYGFRPTHDAVPTDGLLPFAPSFDTIGWFARHAAVMKQVGDVLLSKNDSPPINRLVLAEDALAHVDPTVASCFRRAADDIADDAVRLFDLLPLDTVSQAYQVIQGYEIARSLGPEIERLKPRFGAAIAARFEGTLAIDDRDYEAMTEIRSQFAAHVATLCPPGTALLLPVSPVAHLRKGTADGDLGRFYQAALGLNAVAGHCGLPQLQLPPQPGDDIGLSLVAARDNDHALLSLATDGRLAPHDG